MIADLPAWLSLADAARCVGLSKRTLRRRIDAGELSAELRRQGAQEVWMVQVAELSRWADATGQALQVPDDLRQAATEGGAAPSASAAEGTTGAATADKLRQELSATAAELAATKALLAAVEAERDRVWTHVQQLLPMLPAAREEADEARRALAQERQDRAATAAEADRLRQELAQARQPWWRKVFVRNEGPEAQT